jgi:hypothetical protein
LDAFVTYRLELLAFPEVYHGVADIFVYFTGQGLKQLRRGGRLSYISSNSWLRANYAGPLRSQLRTKTTVEKLIDLGDNRVFADAPDVYPAIHVVRNDRPPSDHVAKAAVFTRGEGLKNFEEKIADKLFPLSIYDQLDSGWQLGDAAERRVFAKLMAGGRPLGEVVDGRMYRGVLTGLNEAFIIDTAIRDRLVREDPASAEVIKPIVRGEDLRPWYQEDEGRWLVFTRRGTDIDPYPSKMPIPLSKNISANSASSWNPNPKTGAATSGRAESQVRTNGMRYKTQLTTMLPSSNLKFSGPISESSPGFRGMLPERMSMTKGLLPYLKIRMFLAFSNHEQPGSVYPSFAYLWVSEQERTATSRRASLSRVFLSQTHPWPNIRLSVLSQWRSPGTHVPVTICTRKRAAASSRIWASQARSSTRN